MKISASFLSIKNNIKENINKLDNSSIDYLHLDIMDNIFVPNKTENTKEILKNTKKPYDIHFMVNDVFKYIDEYKDMNPEFITFHLEAVLEPLEVIKYIKQNNIKVGIALKPKTEVKEIEQYLKYIDLVLIMSVEPGFGGQKFIPKTSLKIDEIKKINKNIIVSIDGGINKETISQVKNADIVVIGSYITSNDDYEQAIKELKEVL